MADVTEREKREKELLALLLLIWASEDLAFWANEFPSPRLFLSKIDQVGIDRLTRRISRRQANDFLDELDWSDSRDRILNRSVIQSDRYNFDLAGRLANHHRGWLLDRDVARTMDQEPPGYEELYDEATGNREAITSITGLASGTELAARADLRDFRGIEVDTYWRLDPRSNWCQLCLNLADSPETVWSMDYPTGPPAHPNCRCFLEHSRVFGSLDVASA